MSMNMISHDGRPLVTQGVRFVCRCPRELVWHVRALNRWLRARKVAHEEGTVRVHFGTLSSRSHEVIGTWLAEV